MMVGEKIKNVLIPLMATLLSTSPALGENAVTEFFKFSTIYSSVNIASPFVAADQYTVGSDRDEDIGVADEEYTLRDNFNFAIGIRKLARFDYEAKSKTFYDGSENSGNESVTIGAVSGWEYLYKYSEVREFGEEYKDSEAFLRYLGNWFVLKGDYRNNGLIDLEYTQLSARLKKQIGGFHFSAGGSYRNHPRYGVNPFFDWMKQNNESWWELAHNYGYQDRFWYNDGNWNQEWDPWEYSAYHWFNEDEELVAESDREFLEHTFDGVIEDFNTSEIKALGLQGELSAVIGVDYYKYTPNWWLHSWVSVLPYHHGLSDFSFDYTEHPEDSIPIWLEWDAGAILGFKMTDNLGFFVEGTNLRYWNINSYEYKTGINYMIF